MGNDREVVEGQVFKISYTYNSSVGTYTYVKNYDVKYLEEVRNTSSYNGSKGMTGCSTTGYVYFKAKKCGSTKIILGNKYRGTKMGNKSIKVKIKKNDGKTPIENIENIIEEEEEEEEEDEEIFRNDSFHISVGTDSTFGKILWVMEVPSYEILARLYFDDFEIPNYSQDLNKFCSALKGKLDKDAADALVDFLLNYMENKLNFDLAKEINGLYYSY